MVEIIVTNTITCCANILIINPISTIVKNAINQGLFGSLYKSSFLRPLTKFIAANILSNKNVHINVKMKNNEKYSVDFLLVFHVDGLSH